MNSSSIAFSTDDAIQIASNYWGIEAQAQALAGEADRNFVLVTAGGDRFVLKVSPAGDSREAVDCQVKALQHLGNTPVAGLVPQVLPIFDGNELLSVEVDGQQCWARMVSYLDGTPLVHRNERPPQFLEMVGRALARLDQALKDFEHPGAQRKIQWDLERAADLAPFAQNIPEAPRRALVNRNLDHFATHVVPKLVDLERSVIHNDGNDHNLLVTSDAGGQPTLAGLIDFGDILHTVTVAELAIACAYLMLDRDEPLADASHIVAGYHAVRPLATGEQAVLFDLIIARLCASVLISARNIRRDPEN